MLRRAADFGPAQPEGSADAFNRSTKLTRQASPIPLRGLACAEGRSRVRAAGNDTGHGANRIALKAVRHDTNLAMEGTSPDAS